MQIAKATKLRSSALFFLFLVLYLIIIFNLYLLQIRGATFFTQLGEKQYRTLVTQYPPRAPIIDRTGNYLAFNKDSVAAFVLPKTLKEPDTTEQFLARHFPQAVERLKKNRHNNFMYIARRLTPEQIDIIQQAALEDIKLLNEPSRYYPIPAASTVLGLTDIDNHGLFGIELSYNTALTGTPTTYALEKDARSGHFYFTKETKISGSEGQPVQLTIDGTLQFLAHEELLETIKQFGAQEGAVIIMNPENGHILAMTCYPSFDPNNTHALDMAMTKNISIIQVYELGSVIKTFSTMAALEEGVVTIDELIDCENVKTTYIDGRKVNTVPASVVGRVPFGQVIEKSNNIGIAKVAKRVGTKLYDHYQRLGFGAKTGVEFPGEQAGFINPPAAWSAQSLFSLSYGYEISATLLQLARAFALIANGGYLVKPTLLATTPTVKGKKVYSDTTLETINEILENTTQRGTTQKAKIKGYSVRSKTGTANLLVNGQYSPTHNIYTCAGIVQKGDYKRVIVTFVKESARNNVYASTVAAPLFERVAEKMIIHEKIM